MKPVILGLIGVLTCCVLSFTLGAIWGGLDAIKYQHNAAVKAGVAHYTVNPQTGETKFEYITKETK